MVDSFLLGKREVNNFQTEFYTQKENKYVHQPYGNMYKDGIIHQKRRTNSSLGSNDDARTVFTTMVEYLDWVGTTECIANDTFSILRHLVPTYNPETFSAYNVGAANDDIREKGLTKDMFTESQIEYLHKMMRSDYGLYHNATHHYGSNCPSVFL